MRLHNRIILTAAAAVVAIGLSSCQKNYERCEFVGTGTSYISDTYLGSMAQGFKFMPDGTGKYALSTGKSTYTYELTYTLSNRGGIWNVKFKVGEDGSEKDGHFEKLSSGRKAFVVGETYHYEY